MNWESTTTFVARLRSNIMLLWKQQSRKYLSLAMSTLLSKSSTTSTNMTANSLLSGCLFLGSGQGLLADCPSSTLTTSFTSTLTMPWSAKSFWLPSSRSLKQIMHHCFWYLWICYWLESACHMLSYSYQFLCCSFNILHSGSININTPIHFNLYPLGFGESIYFFIWKWVRHLFKSLLTRKIFFLLLQ